MDRIIGVPSKAVLLWRRTYGDCDISSLHKAVHSTAHTPVNANIGVSFSKESP